MGEATIFSSVLLSQLQQSDACSLGNMLPEPNLMDVRPFPGTLLPPSVVARIQAERSLNSVHSASSGWVNTIADNRLETGDCFRRRAPEEKHAALLPQTALQPWILEWVPWFYPFTICETCVKSVNRLTSLPQMPPSFSPENPGTDCLDIFIYSLILRLQCNTC